MRTRSRDVWPAVAAPQTSGQEADSRSSAGQVFGGASRPLMSLSDSYRNRLWGFILDPMSECETPNGVARKPFHIVGRKVGKRWDR